MHVIEHPTGRFESPPLLAAGDAVAEWSAGTLGGLGVTPDALVVVTAEVGAREAVAFWAAAQQTGLRFAAPGAFPWTLANGVAGRISVVLGVRGACTTLVGTDLWDDALSQAREDVAEHGGSVLVVHLDPSEPTTDAVPRPGTWTMQAVLLEA